MQPPVDLVAHDLAFGERVVEAAQQRPPRYSRARARRAISSSSESRRRRAIAIQSSMVVALRMPSMSSRESPGIFQHGR